MKHKDIPREHWRVFCEQFSRQHRGWLTTLAVMVAAVTAATAAGTVRAAPTMFVSFVPVSDLSFVR